MNAQQPNQYQPAPQATAAQSETKTRKVARIAKSRWAIGGAAFLLGAAVFGGSGGQPATNAAPAPTATRTVTTEKVVEKAPAACLDALVQAETTMTTAARGFQITAKIFNSASHLDAAGVRAGNEELTALTPVMRADRAAYDAAAAKCRAAN